MRKPCRALEVIEPMQAEQRARVIAGESTYGSEWERRGLQAAAQAALEEASDLHSYMGFLRRLTHPAPNGAMRVYVAGPYTAPTRMLVNRNVLAAQDAGAELMRRGHYPLIPHTMTALWDVVYPDLTHAQFLALGLQWLPLCHAILLLPGWEMSRGSMAEYEAAVAGGLVVFPDMEAVPIVRTEEGS